MSEEPAKYESGVQHQPTKTLEITVLESLHDRIQEAAAAQGARMGMNMSSDVWMLTAIMRQLESEQAGLMPLDKFTIDEIYKSLPDVFKSRGQPIKHDLTERLITGTEIYRVLESMGKV